MKEKIYKNITEFVFYQHLLLGMGSDLRCGLYSQLDSIVGNKCFICKWLSVGGNFLFMTGSSCLLSPLSTGTLPGLNLCRPCPCCHSLPESIRVCHSCSVWRTLLPWCHPSPLALFQIASWALRRGVWWRHSISDWVLQGSILRDIENLKQQIWGK